jgi:hypothetical protein
VEFVPSLTPGTPATPPGVPGAQASDLPPQAVIKRNRLSSRKARTRRATGVATDDHQVVRVEVAVVRKRRNRCRELGSNQRFSGWHRCRKPRSFLAAKGTTRWTFNLRPRLAKGYYVVYARAIDNSGRQQTSFGTKSRRPLRIR